MLGLSLLTHSRASVDERQPNCRAVAMRARRHVDPDSLRHAAAAEQVADYLVCNCAVEDRQTMVVDWDPLFEGSEGSSACQCGSAQVSIRLSDVV